MIASKLTTNLAIMTPSTMAGKTTKNVDYNHGGGGGGGNCGDGSGDGVDAWKSRLQ
jgi:hypothetical protein